jgi:Sulfatase
MISKRFIFIPLLILLYYFVHYTSDLYYFLDPGKSFLQFIKYVLTAGLLFVAGYKLCKDKERYTLGFSILLFIFLFFGSITDTAVSVNLLKPKAGVGITMVCGFLLVCTVIVFMCIKLNQNSIKKLLRFWMFYCLALIVYDCVSFILKEKKEKKYLATQKEVKGFYVPEKPSVFFLLLDMYPSDTVLKKYFSFDNAAFSSFLKEEDFFVSGNARSLYIETYYSLPSTMSLQPLPYFDDSTVAGYKKKLIALKNIRHALLPAIFEKSGYVFRNFSVFDLQDHPSPLRFSFSGHLNNALTSATFFNRFYDAFEPDLFLANRGIDAGFIKTSWSDNVKTDLTSLVTNFNLLMDSFPGLKQPSFNYFHFMMPHPPMLYDSNGHVNSASDMYAYNGFEKTSQNFVSFVKYANGELKKMVQKIFEKAGKNVIIIIQGDHGYREFSDRFPDMVRYGVLNAVYLSGKNYSGLNDSISVINTFKQVLKNQFNYELIP